MRLTATMQYTPQEYADMVIAYGLAGESAHLAARIYAERFPGRARHPTRRTICRVVQKFRETGCLVHNTRAIPVRRRVQDEERVLNLFFENPGMSVRRAACELHLSQHDVHRTLRDNQLHPYHYQRVQQLLPRDLEQRIYFCEGIVSFPFRIYDNLKVKNIRRVSRAISAEFLLP